MLLVVSDTQVPLQSVMPVEHWQRPVRQLFPPVVEHTVPHPPQLALLVCRSTQAPAQLVGAALPQQVPLLQSPAQAVPRNHVPLVAQLSGVWPSQSRDEGEHSPVHWPALQTNGQSSLDVLRRSGPHVILVLALQ